MQKEEIEKIIDKYRKLSLSNIDEKKAHKYERFVYFIEENFEIFEEDEYYETEKELMENFEEVESDTSFEYSDDDDY
jgi:hypothetical protein